MPLDVRQLRDLVIRPTLEYLDLPSPAAAERLLLGTAAQESRFQYIAQIKGPALGLYQIEPATFRDLWERALLKHRTLRDKVESLAAPMPEPVHQLVSNLRFATAMCRVFYFLKPFTLSDDMSTADLARVWKKYYNTHLGRGTESEFILNYNRYVTPHVRD